MEFKIISHTYENTGGNTMVSYFQVWLPEENRTIFVNANEEGATFATVDFYHGEIEDYFDTIICDFIADNPDVNHKYFEIFRHCINEYFKHDCKRFDYMACLPYELLSDDLKQKVTPEYKKWIGDGDYQTDGYFIFEDPDFLERKRAIKETIAKLRVFQSAYNELLKGWDCKNFIDLNDLEAINLYPFERGFDEYNVDDWVDEMVRELRNKI